jgi:prephenate dehydrogenase
MIVCILGVGHIGGSMAIDLKEHRFADHIIGVDARQENLDKAIRRRLIDADASLEEALAQADVLVVSVPVSSMMTLLPELLDRINDRQVVIEVGSTKSKLLEPVRNHPKRGRLVATHPMAGTEYSGPEAAIPRLFEGKCAVFCETECSDPDAVALAQKLYDALNMKVVYLGADEHDVHTAYVSHISHISSFALALTVLAKEKDENQIFQLASTGFGSTVRLAKSSPDMWTPIFEQNRDNLLDVLDEYINTLSNFRTSLIKKDFKKCHQMMQDANQIRKIIN